MASLWAILGLNATSFKRDLDKARADARTAGKAMAKDLTVTPGGPAPGGGGGGGSHGGVKSGAMRETLVLIREIGRGNWSRVPGSLSILMQQLGALKYLFNPITIGVAALAGGIYLAYKWTEKLTTQLTDLKWPDTHPEYIAKHLQKASQIVEIHKEINKEVEKSVELYQSAAKAAERLADVARDNFDHQRKMNKANEQEELNKATSERQRQAIRAKYAAKELQTNAAEREEQRKNKQKEAVNLLNESNKKEAMADAISVNSKEHDEELLRQKKKAAEEAQKFLDTALPEQHSYEEGQASLAAMNVNTALPSNVETPRSSAADEAAEERKKNIDEARRRIQDAKNYEDQKAANDELRKKKEELTKGAAESRSKSATALLESKQMEKDNARKNKNEKEESDASLKAENSKRFGGGHHNDVNALQRIGAYTIGRDGMSDSVKTIAHHVAQIAGRQKSDHHSKHHSGHVPGFGHH